MKIVPAAAGGAAFNTVAYGAIGERNSTIALRGRRAPENLL